jgi:hypothetical protein
MTKTAIRNRNLQGIVCVLTAAGEMFHGGDVLSAAGAWDRCGFTPAGVELWTAAGFWDADSASYLYDAGFSAAQCKRIATRWDDDAIYEICNGDRPAKDIVDAYYAS